MINSKYQGLPRGVSTQTQRRETQQILQDHHSNGNPIYGTVKIHYGSQVFEVGHGKAERNGDGYKITLIKKDEIFLDKKFDLTKFRELSEKELSDLAKRVVNLSHKRSLSEEENILLRITQSVLEQYSEKEREIAFDSLI